MGSENIRPKTPEFMIDKVRKLRFSHDALDYIEKKYGSLDDGLTLFLSIQTEKKIGKKYWECLVDFAYACCLWEDKAVDYEVIKDSIDLANLMPFVLAIMPVLGYSLPEVKKKDPS